MARLHQRQDTNSAAANAQAMDLLRRKYAAQNRAIAKSHASLEDKISQLEHATGQLMNENYELKCEVARLKKNDGMGEDIKSRLRAKWAEMENLLDGGREEEEGMDIGHSEQTMQLSMITKRKRKGSDEDKRVEELQQVDNSMDHSTLLEDSIPEEEEPVEVELNEPEPVQVENEPPVEEVVGTVVEEQPVDLLDSLDNSGEVEEVTHVSSSTLEVIEEPPVKEPEPVKEAEPKPKAKPRKSSQIAKKTVPTKPANNDTTTADNTTTTNNNSNITKKRKALEPKSANEPRKERAKKQKTLPIENDTMPHTIVSPPRRRSSRGSQVNYALPSLRTKMRRDHETLVDAVDQEDAEPVRRKSTRKSIST